MLMFSLDFSAELAKSYTNVAFAPSIVRPAPSTAEARVAPLATVMFASVTSNVAVLIVVVVVGETVVVVMCHGAGCGKCRLIAFVVT